jgi:hypothetical protein
MVLVAPGLMAIPPNGFILTAPPPVLRLRWPFRPMVNWNKAASLRHCRMGGPLPKTEFQSPSENRQIRTGINSTVRRHRAFSAKIRARTKWTSRILSAPVLKTPLSDKTDGQDLSHTEPILAIDEGEPCGSNTTPWWPRVSICRSTVLIWRWVTYSVCEL